SVTTERVGSGPIWLSRHHDVIRASVNAVVRRTSSEDRVWPRTEVGRIEISQRSSLLVCYSFRRHGRYWAVKRRDFITLRRGRSLLGASTSNKALRRYGPFSAAR